jgi:hypothetical protein
VHLDAALTQLDVTEADVSRLEGTWRQTRTLIS